MSRDSLYQKLKDNDIFGRRYFYPLISDFPVYKGLPSSAPKRLPVARKMAEEVICLPIYAGLGMEEVEKISAVIGGVK
jgi:dTDP-4-amino-4,6-dideoxygalactose transaminase